MRNPPKRWTLAQWGLLVIALIHVPWAVAGFIAEPSFAIGPDAPTASVLGMDYNGWHAVAGLMLFVPGLFLAVRNSWSVLYLLFAGVSGGLSGVWALASSRVLYVLHMPNHIPDAILHLVTATIMVAIAVIQVRRDGGWRNTLQDLPWRQLQTTT